MKNLIIFFSIVTSLFILSNPIYSQNDFSKPHDVFPGNPEIKVKVPDFITPFTNESVVFNNVNVSNNSAPQNEPSVKISRKNPNIVVAAWRDFRLGIDPTAVRRVGYSRSTDGGMTWSVSALLDSTLLPGGLLRNSDATVGTDTAGNFYVGVIALNNSDGNGTLAIYKSTDQGITFPTAVIMAQSGGTGEDKEYLTTDFTPNSPFKNTLYMSWTRFSGATGIKLTKSTNGGLNWTAPIAVSDQAFGGQVSDPAVGVNGEVYVTWQAGNNVLFDKSTNSGNTFGIDKTIATGNQPPNLPNGVVTFPSIATDFASTRNGNGIIYVTFCDSRNADPDIFLVRSLDRGNTWSTPLRINNDAINNGKLQYWPWIVSEQGIVSVVFMDNRNTGSNVIVEAWLARSTDHGLTFTNELMSTQQTPTAIPGSNVRFGDYIGVDSYGGHVVPVWTDERAGGFNMDIYSAIIDVPVGIEPGVTGIPDKFELKQNYPNPFNPSTTIWFSVAKPSHITLNVYNSLGQLLETTIEESLGAGRFSVKWDGSKYSSGVYFYTLISSDGFRETKKMLLVK